MPRLPTGRRTVPNEALREAISRGEAEGDEPEPVEPETPDETDEEGEAETPPPVPPVEPPAMTEKDIAERNDKLDREAKRHRDRVGEIMGADAHVLLPCPLCIDNVPGFTVPPELIEYTAEEKNAVLVILGEDAPTPLREAEGVAMCDRCDGYGMLKYPTKVPHVAEQQCPKCTGTGYVNLPIAQTGNGGNLQFGQQNVTETRQAAGPLYPDSFGRPVGHPHYGMNPADVGA